MSDLTDAVQRDVERIANEMSRVSGADLTAAELAVLTEAVTAVHTQEGRS